MTPDEPSPARERQADARRPLQEVYAVTLGVALALGVDRVVDLDRSGIPVQPQALLPFVAFVVTGFALYHWAVRFIDLSEAEASLGGGRVGAIVAMLLVGPLEMLLMIGLSVMISRPLVFGWTLVVLLVFEVLAGAGLRLTGAYGPVEWFGRRYLVIHAAAALAAIVGMLVASGLDERAFWSGVVAAAVAVGRTGAFYGIGFRLLFAR